MATMDLIAFPARQPSGLPRCRRYRRGPAWLQAFRIILKDTNVKAIFIKIFGGIVRCDRVARGIKDAYHNIGEITVPIIVRLNGTNAKKAKDIE